MKKQKKIALRCLQALLCLPYMVTMLLFFVVGGLLALIHYVCGRKHYAKRLWININEII